MIEEIIKELDNLGNIKIDDLDIDKTLFISIDMNNGFVKEGALSSIDVLNIVDETKDIFKYIKDRGYETLAYTDTHDIDSIEFKSYPPHCIRYTKESEVIDEIKDYMDIIIPKASTNGFLTYNPIDDRDEIDTYVISGCCTDICVYQYAINLKTYCNEHNLDRRIIVAKNITETFDAPYHNHILYNAIFFKSMLNNGIEVYNLIK